MVDCQHCKYAKWDYDDFNFCGHIRKWFLTGCRKDEDQETCEEYVAAEGDD